MPAKRIILMYISKVSGHRSAANAIEKAIKLISPEAEVLNINAFKYTSPIVEKIIHFLYLTVVSRMPGVWGYLYDNPSVVKRLEGIKKFVHRFNSPKLKKLFDEFKPDAVACTQAYPCGMIADYKKFYNSALPLVAVLTDFVPHSYWVYDTIDYYVTPSEQVSRRLEKKGVSPQKIKEFGIPLDPKFTLTVDRGIIFKKFGLDASLPTVLIMGGGHGIGPINSIIKSLEKTDKRIQEVVVTGVNRKLFCSLNRKAKKLKNKMAVLGFVDYIDELMSIADLIITKPGGITTAEALTKKLPMIIIKPIPGQEVNNTEFLTAKNAALKVDNIENLYKIINDMFSDPQKLDSYRNAAAGIAKPNSSLEIAKLLLGT